MILKNFNRTNKNFKKYNKKKNVNSTSCISKLRLMLSNQTQT